MKVGVLLAQLGTPDAPTVPAVRAYLREFLGDRRVVDLPRLLWWPILHGIILRTRPKRSAALYERIWTDRGSPLLFHTEDLAAALDARLGDTATVACGMRIGSPSIAERLDNLVAQGCERLRVVPCFPQFSTATTLSIHDAIATWTKANPGAPRPELAPSFPDHPAYIAALAASVRAAGVHPTAREPLLMSFHGLPQKFVDRGDPYPQECERTALALAAALGLPADAWHMAFQSRFGAAEWIKPYADATVAAWPERGITRASVIAPSFLADCLETIDELGRELRATFLEAGGEELVRIPCLNSSPQAVDALAGVLAGEARGT
ncbi:MAG: ferrochelatase [Planctomycetota bacterium]|nr:ferrochelatase [Planctomycetota bacterium]